MHGHYGQLEIPRLADGRAAAMESGGTPGQFQGYSGGAKGRADVVDQWSSASA